jgi:GT2 family glycosyltransferase
MPEKAPSIWVVVLNWNGMEHLEYMLPSFLSCDYPAHVHLLFVDACSTDESCEYARKHGGGKMEIYVLPDNLGWAGGNNHAIRYAVENGAEYVVLLNNDMRFSPRWLTDSMSVFRDRPDAGVVGCEIFNDLGSFEQATNDYSSMKHEEAAYIPGCCMIIPVEVLRNVGLINEEYEFYAEEDDFEVRAKRAGYKLYCTNVPIWHFHDGSMRHFPEKKAYLAMRNAILFSRRYDPVFLTIAKVVNIFLCTTIKNWRKHTMTNRRYYAKNPLFNLGIFFRALSWNMKDAGKRGYRSVATPPPL